MSPFQLGISAQQGHSSMRRAVVCCRVTKAAKGAALFETVSEREYEGRVTARAQGKGITATSGLLHYSGDGGLPATITFGTRDLLVRI